MEVNTNSFENYQYSRNIEVSFGGFGVSKFRHIWLLESSRGIEVCFYIFLYYLQHLISKRSPT